MIHPLASRNPEALPVGMTSQRGAPNKSRLVPPLVVLLGLFLAGSGTWLRAEPGAGKSSPPSAAKEKEVILRDFHGDPLPPGAVARLGTVRGRHGGPITSLAWSSDSKRLLTSGSDSLVRLWDPNTGKELRRFTGNTDNIDGVALSPDDKLVASAGEDGTVRAWEVDSGKVRFAHEGVLAGKPLRCVAFSPDGKLLAAGGGSSGDSGLVLLAMPSGKVLHTLGDGKAFLPCVAFSPDGKLLAAAEDPQPWNNKPGRKEKAPAGVRLWDVATGKEQRFLGEHPGIMSVAFSPDGKGLATGGRDTNVCLWDVGTGKLLRRMAVPPTESRNSFVRTGHRASYAVAFSPDGRWLASANHNATVTLWNLHARKHTTLLGHSGGVIALAFSPDSKRLATGSYDSTFRIWDPVTGKPLHTPPAHSGAVRALAISPDGKVAATMGSDHTVRLWDPRTGRPGRALHRPEMEFTLFTLTLAFSPDGSRPWICSMG
jgi:WD40 repeat protein